jgi:hypothetical protein
MRGLDEEAKDTPEIIKVREEVYNKYRSIFKAEIETPASNL